MVEFTCLKSVTPLYVYVMTANMKTVNTVFNNRLSTHRLLNVNSSIHFVWWFFFLHLSVLLFYMRPLNIDDICCWFILMCFVFGGLLLRLKTDAAVDVLPTVYSLGVSSTFIQKGYCTTQPQMSIAGRKVNNKTRAGKKTENWQLKKQPNEKKRWKSQNPYFSFCGAYKH